MVQASFNDLVTSWLAAVHDPQAERIPKQKIRQLMEWSGRFTTILDANRAVWVHRAEQAPPDVNIDVYLIQGAGRGGGGRGSVGELVA